MSTVIKLYPYTGIRILETKDEEYPYAVKTPFRKQSFLTLENAIDYADALVSGMAKADENADAYAGMVADIGQGITEDIEEDCYV